MSELTSSYDNERECDVVMLAAAFSEAMTDRNLSIRKLAAACKVSPSMIVQVREGKCLPSPSLAHQLFQALALPIELRREYVRIWGRRTYERARAWDRCAEGFEVKE